MVRRIPEERPKQKRGRPSGRYRHIDTHPSDERLCLLCFYSPLFTRGERRNFEPKDTLLPYVLVFLDRAPVHLRQTFACIPDQR